MIRLPATAHAWETPEFAATFKGELSGLDRSVLPLQGALTHSSIVLDRALDVMIISATAQEDAIRIHAGVFFTGILAGCSCADDPTPVNENNEYCEIRIDLDRRTGDARITLAESE